MATLQASETPSVPNTPNTETQRVSEKPSTPTVSQTAAQAGLATYRIARNVKRLHSHASRIVGAFDPSFNDDFGGDDDDSDYSADSDDSDNEDDDDNDDDEKDSVYSEHSDDQSIHEDDEINNHEHQDNDTAAHTSNGLSSSATRGISKSLKGLPVTRSAKPSGLVTSSSTAVVSSPRSATTNPSGLSFPSATVPSPAQTKETKPTTISVSNPVASKIATPTPAKTRTDQAATVKQTEELKTDAVQYQIVKVRKPDGTIVKVKRPIKPTAAKEEEAKLASEAKPTPKVKMDSTLHDAGFVTQAKIVQEEPTSTPETTKEVKPTVTVTEKDLEKNGTISSEEISKPPPTPTNAQKLARRTSRAAQVTIWTIMIAVPLLFLILAILTAVVTGKPANLSIGKGITQANKVAVSLWPIVYAAIAAQALRMYASYKVERGLRLMTLEQLISSHSVASAIKQPFLLQRFTWTSLALLCLWSLSPLAGQAFLRMSYLGPSGAVFNTTLQYLDSAVSPVTFTGAATSGEFGPNVNALFGSLILAPLSSQKSSMDTWGNIKIPILSSLNTTDSNGWSTVSSSSSPSYSSLLGIPVSGLTQNSGNSTFTIQTAYFSFSPCVPMKNLSIDAVQAAIAAAVYFPMVNASSLTLHMAVIPPVPENNTNGTIFFASQLDAEYNSNAYTTCNFSQIFVETEIFCSGQSCAAQKMRGLSTAPHTNDNDTVTGNNYLNMMNGFVNVGAATQTGIYTPTQFYLQDPGSAGVNDFGTSPDPSTLPITDFTSRLAILINSYWLAAVAPYDFTGTIKTGSVNDVVPLSVTATSTSTESVYHTSWGWLTLLLFSAVLLLLGGVAGAFLDAKTIGPDIFGFTSSLAHKNKYMKLDPEDAAADTGKVGGQKGVKKAATRSSVMGGPQRARLLGDMKVMLKDVRPDKEVGKIALGTVDGFAGGHERLRRGRLYK